MEGIPKKTDENRWNTNRMQSRNTASERLCVEWRVVIVFAFDGMVIDCSISRFLFLVFHLFSNVLIDGVSLEWLLGVRFVVSVERCDCIDSPCIYNRLRFCWIGFQRISSVFICFDWLIVSLSQYCCSLAVFLDLLFIFRVFPPLSYVLIDYMSLLRVGLVCVMMWGVEEMWSCLLSWDWRSLAVSLDWFLSYFISYLVFWLIEFLCWVFFIDFSRISSLILCFDWLRLFLECLPGDEERRCYSFAFPSIKNEQNYKDRKLPQRKNGYLWTSSFRADVLSVVSVCFVTKKL